MLKALVRHPRQPLSRDKLAQLARGREFEPFDRSLDVQISRLRKMLEPDPASRATSRRSGAWAMSSCRMAPTEMDPGAQDRRGAPPLIETRAKARRPVGFSLFWRTFFLLACCWPGACLPGCRPCARWNSSRAPCRPRSRRPAW
jgi:hypothetical protein